MDPCQEKVRSFSSSQLKLNTIHCTQSYHTRNYNNKAAQTEPSVPVWGVVAEYTDVDTLYNQPRHPYTQALLKAFPISPHPTAS
jgi:ABC-type oligopeptide transport system ATPase subunit